MKEAKKVELIAKHAAARRRLRAEGAEESLGNVLKLAGGSKRDIVALWTESDPDTAPLPMTEAEEAFRRTFADYLAAATRFNAISGIAVQYAYPPLSGRRPPPLTRRYALSSHHPWYKDLEEAVATAYQAHMDAWAVLEGRQEAERIEPEPEPALEPEPEPELNMANLRMYYQNQPTSPWPGGMSRALPVELYPILQRLWTEASTEIGKADRAYYDTMNALSQQGVGDVDEHPQMRQVDTRRSVARLMLHSIQSDMENVRARAHREGIELPDPRLSEEKHHGKICHAQ